MEKNKKLYTIIDFHIYKFLKLKKKKYKYLEFIH